jgi:hypothetical protein
LAELVIVCFVFGLLGFQVWGIVDVVRRPDHQWRAIGQEKMLWLLVVLLAGLPGVIVYLAIAKPKFERMPALACPPGWYPDPVVHGIVRYWDGLQWTQHVTQVGPAPNAPSVDPRNPR